MAEVAEASSFQSLLLQLERQHAKEAGTSMVPQLENLKRFAHVEGSNVAPTEIVLEQSRGFLLRYK